MDTLKNVTYFGIQVADGEFLFYAFSRILTPWCQLLCERRYTGRLPRRFRILDIGCSADSVSRK